MIKRKNNPKEKNTYIKSPKDVYVNNHTIGRFFELIGQSIFPGSIDMNIEKKHRPFDLLLGEKKIEVKVRNKRREDKENSNAWTFKKNKSMQADYYLLFCLEKNILKKVIFIPIEEFSHYIKEDDNKWDKFTLYTG